MGVFVVRDGITVELDDRLWSFDETISPVAPNAFIGSKTLDPEQVWRTQRSVRMVVGFLARNIAQVNVHAFTMQADGDRERLGRTAPLSQLLLCPGGRPNGATGYESMRDLVADVCLWERWAARFALSDTGPTIVRLPPKMWKFKRDALNRPAAIVTASSSGELTEQPLDGFVWLDGYPCPGEKPLEYLAALLAEEQESQNYRIELWRKGARLGGWIERPSAAPPWSEQAKGKFRQGWREYAAGGARPGETPILEDDMKYHEVKEAITPESAQQLEARKFSLAEAAAAFYVPPVFVGLLDYTSHSNVDAYHEILYSDTLGPWFQQIQQAWNIRLVHRPQLGTDELTFVEFNVGEKLRLSFEKQMSILQSAVGGPFVLRNEARQRINLPKIAGADELIVPLNVVTGGQASPTDSAPPQE